jgi:pimeloyl-ACP methyl ester carboxylesterase
MFKNTLLIILFRILFLPFAFLIASCSIMEIREQSNVIENRVEFSGKVEVKASIKGDAYAAILTDEGGFVRWIDKYKVGNDGRYIFHVIPGKYILGAYADENGDGIYQSNEPANYVRNEHGKPTIFIPEKRERVSVKALIVDGPIKQATGRLMVTDLKKATNNIGAVVSMEDQRFSDEYSAMGMWKPLDFANQVGGGLFMLNTFDENKIPIIFVHGIGGSPSNFKEVAALLDKSKFQPWVFHYASGARLDIISDFLLKSVNQLESQYKFKQFYVVAHSMGGLVTLSFIKKYQSGGGDAKITFAMTINSPIGGMNSAKTGVDHSPVVVPSWRDVATGSPFIKDLESWSWPAEIPYHLVFSYMSGEDGDGVVPLISQIPSYLQKRAVRLYGYNDGHASVLKNDLFLKDLNLTLKNASR